MRIGRLLSLAAVFAAATFLAPAAPVSAAPVAQCRVGAITQYDMAGVYVSSAHQMRVEIFACGGAYVQWDNAYGTHYASYGTVRRVPGEGVIARRLTDSVERLDAVDVIGFKAAERGFIQVFTVNAYGDFVGTYRLQKIS